MVLAAFERLESAATKIALQRIGNLTTDAKDDDLHSSFGLSHETVSQLVGMVNTHNAQQVNRSVGMVAPGMTPGELKRVARETLANVRGIVDAVDKRLVSTVAKAAREGLRGDALVDAIQKGLAVERARAKDIAVGQVIQINAQLTRERHQKLGITEYVWRCVPDQHTRAWHRKLNGKTFSYASPPEGGGGGPHDHGNPGTADKCRCQGLPVIPKPQAQPKATPQTKAAPKPQATVKPVLAPPKLAPSAPAPPPVLSPKVEAHFDTEPVVPVATPKPLAKAPVAEPYQRTAPPRVVHATSEAVDAIATEPERNAILAFTGQDYVAMRAAEAKGEAGELLEHSKAIQQLLRKAEKAGHAYDGIVYRGIADVDEDVVQSFATVGKEIDMRGTASTSTSLAVSESFAQLDRDFDTNALVEPTLKGWSVVFRAKNRRGIPIMTMSATGTLENEVMQPLGAKFRVLSAFRPSGTSRVLYVDVEGL